MAYTLLTQEAFPSWMYSIKHGATTIWERWDGWTEHNGFQTPSMNSFNHYSLGSVGEWMFRYMAGLEADPAQPGFRRAIVRPLPGGRLTEAKAEYESLYGVLSTDWKLSPDGRFRLNVRVPAGATAAVFVPGADVRMDGQPASGAGESSAIEIGSGEYVFESHISSIGV